MPDDVYQLTQKVDWLRANIKKILALTGKQGQCRGCGVDIWWLRHNGGAAAPYTIEGLNHFADCPKAKDFKKGD